MLWIGGDRDQCLGGLLEQEIVDDGFVGERQDADGGRQGEDDVIIGNRQKLGLTFGEPLARRLALALWTVPIAAGVVGDAFVRAVGTLPSSLLSCAGK